MGLPKRYGANGRCHSIHKDSAVPAKADQRIQDALDGTAEENHSGHPTVVRRIP